MGGKVRQAGLSLEPTEHLSYQVNQNYMPHETSLPANNWEAPQLTTDQNVFQAAFDFILL